MVDRRIAIIVGATVLLVDQITKDLVIALLDQGQALELGPFMIRHARNPGAALGLLGDVPEGLRLPLMVVLVVLALIVLLPALAARMKPGPGRQAAIALVIVGAIGNLCDRVRHGEVVDFIGLPPAWGVSAPIFNLADVAIVTGALVLLWGALRQPRIRQLLTLPGGTL